MTDRIDLKIEKLVFGGDGLAHRDGETLFVPFVLPGEAVTARAVERKKKFVRARLLEVVTPSGDRAAPPCRHFTDCGGCHYQHITYEAQLRLKSEILRETLQRIGRVRWDGPIQVHPSPALGYRNRAQWKIRPRCGAAGQPPGSLAIGYFRAGSSTLCAASECPILSPKLAATLDTLRSVLARGELPETLRELEAFADDRGEKLLLNASLVSFPASPASVAETLRAALPGVVSVLLHESAGDRMELVGPGYLHYRAGEVTFRVGHLSFFQANRFLIDEMVHVVTGEEQGRLALDLFAGVGLFAAALARRFERVVAVESNPAAARDLQVNLETCGGASVPVNAEAEKFLSEWTDPPELVVLDPPRAGLPPAALERLRQLAPARITYVSCDPATLARDLAALAGRGYAIAEVRLFDAFPQTFHIESIVRLVRNG